LVLLVYWDNKINQFQIVFWSLAAQESWVSFTS